MMRRTRYSTTKSAVLAVLFLGVVHANLSIANVYAQTGTTSPIEVTRQFYDWYLHSDLPAPEKKNLAVFRKYVTQKLLKQQMDPDVDADLFLDAQDFDESGTWKNNLSVSKATIRGQQATTFVYLNGKVFKWKLRVTLRRENGAWKIAAVKNLGTS